MSVSWSATDLSVSPPSRQMADGDRETLGFDAGQAISSADATIHNLKTGADMQGPIASGTSGNPAPIEAVAIAVNVVNVTVSGLTRGTNYELSVRFATSGGRRWTRTLVLVCPA